MDFRTVHMLSVRSRMSNAWRLLSLAASVVIVSEASADGIDLYLEACRNRGDNPAVIQSLRADLEASIVTEPPSREQIEKRLEHLRQGMTEDITRFEKAGNTVMAERFKAQLAKIEEWATPQILAQARRRLRVHVLYRRSPETGNDQYLFTMRRFVSDKDAWSEPVVGLREIRHGANVKGISFESDVRVAVFDKGAFTVGIRDVRQFGRIQGQPALMTTASFIVRSDPPVLDLSEEKIARFKEEAASLSRKHPDVHSYQIKGSLPFEGSRVWIIESERDENGSPVLLQRIWIDAARGAICPLVELFYQNGRTAQRWESSNYIKVEESGLWYPQRHEYTEFDESGAMKLQETYQIDPGSVQINFNPDASQFAFSLPEGCSVIDARTATHKTYKPDRAVMVSLESLADDIQSLPVVVDAKGHPETPVSTSTFHWWLIGFNALVICILAVNAVQRYYYSKGCSTRAR